MIKNFVLYGLQTKSSGWCFLYRVYFSLLATAVGRTIWLWAQVGANSTVTTSTASTSGVRSLEVGVEKSVGESGPW